MNKKTKRASSLSDKMDFGPRLPRHNKLKLTQNLLNETGAKKTNTKTGASAIHI